MNCFLLALSVAGLAVLPSQLSGDELRSSVRLTNEEGPVSAHDRPQIKHRLSIEIEDGDVGEVAFSPDAKLLACAGDRDVHLFRVTDGSRLKRLSGHTDSVRCVAFSRDGKMLASGSEDTAIRLWDTRSWKLIKVLEERRRYLAAVNSVAFTPDGRKLVSCSSRNRGTSHLWIWDVERGWWEYIVQTSSPRYPLHVAVSPDGKLICAGEFPGNVALYEFVKFGVRERFVREQGTGIPQGYYMHHDDDREVSSVAFSHDGKTILSTARDNTVRLWDVETGRQWSKISGAKDKQGFAGAVFSPDSTSIISVTKENTIQVWDVSNGQLLATGQGSDESVRGIQISSGGNMLATFGSGGKVELWDIASLLKNDK